MEGGEEIKRTRARGMQGDRRRRIVPETRSSSPALTPVGVQVTREGPPWNRSLASSTPPVCPAAFLKPGDPAPTRAARTTRGGTQSGGSRKSRDEKSNLKKTDGLRVSDTENSPKGSRHQNQPPVLSLLLNSFGSCDSQVEHFFGSEGKVASPINVWFKPECMKLPRCIVTVNTTKRNSGFLHIWTNGFPGLFQDFKPNSQDQTEISV